jgi:hypothetical protein
MKSITADQAIAALQASKGNVAAAARVVGYNRTSFWRYIAAHPTVKDAVTDEREVMLDNAESVLYRAVLSGEAWAVCFFLKTQGKSRGYIERQEHSGPDGGPIVMKWPEDGG